MGTLKLTVLGYSCAEFSELVLAGSIHVQKMIPTSLALSQRTVKILALQSIGPNLDEVVKFHICFPCTEKLYVEIQGVGVEKVAHYNNPIECLEFHLTEITLNEYRATNPEIQFASFFVQKARVLKVMRFALYLVCHNGWFIDQRRRLQWNGKGSAEADFHFGISYDRLFKSDSIEPIYDFSVDDPFAEIFHPIDPEDWI